MARLVLLIVWITGMWPIANMCARCRVRAERTLCPPTTHPAARGDEIDYDDDICDNSKCSSIGNDCCAPDGESASCYNDYYPVRANSWEDGCWGYDNGLYTCCSSGDVTADKLDETNNKSDDDNDATAAYEEGEDGGFDWEEEYNPCREFDNLNQLERGQWNMDEDCCAGVANAACADGYTYASGDVCHTWDWGCEARETICTRAAADGVTTMGDAHETPTYAEAACASPTAGQLVVYLLGFLGWTHWVVWHWGCEQPRWQDDACRCNGKFDASPRIQRDGGRSVRNQLWCACGLAVVQLASGAVMVHTGVQMGWAIAHTVMGCWGVFWCLVPLGKLADVAPAGAADEPAIPRPAVAARPGAVAALNFEGVFRDSGDRAMPGGEVWVNRSRGFHGAHNGGDAPPDAEALRAELAEFAARIRREGQREGFFSLQYGSQLSRTVGPTRHHERHGRVGMRASGCNSNNTLDLRLAGFNGVVNVLGGPWQNAVYRVTVPDDEPPAAALAAAPLAREVVVGVEMAPHHAEKTSVVEGRVVGVRSVQPLSAGVDAPPPASETTSLAAMTQKIKHQLGIAPETPMAQAIDEACAALGIDANGLNLKEKVERCFAEVS